MSSFRVEYPVLRERIKELIQQYELLRKEIQELAGYTADMDIFWDGDVNSAYVAKIGEDLMWAAVLLVRIRDTIRLAQRAFDIYTEGERHVAMMIGQYGKKDRKGG